MGDYSSSNRALDGRRSTARGDDLGGPWSDAGRGEPQALAGDHLQHLGALGAKGQAGERQLDPGGAFGARQGVEPRAPRLLRSATGCSPRTAAVSLPRSCATGNWSSICRSGGWTPGWPTPAGRSGTAGPLGELPGELARRDPPSPPEKRPALLER